MRFRTKLLLLLLAIALVPMIGMRIAFVGNVRSVADRIVADTQDGLIADAESRLFEQVESYASVIWTERERLEEAVRLQASEVERCLAREPETPGRVFFAGDLNQAGPDLPLNLTPSPTHFREARGGSVEMVKVSYAAQVFVLAPGAKKADLTGDIGRLSCMTGAYRKMGIPPLKQALWHYICLDDGLMSVYPAHPGLPERLDFFSEPWFGGPETQDRPWSRPFIDRTTGKVVLAVSHRITRPDGRPAGVTSLIMPMDAILEHRRLVRNIPPDTHFFMSYLGAHPKTGRKAIANMASDIYRGGGYRAWQPSAEQRWLNSPNTDEYREMMADFEAGKANVRRMTYKGRDSLWAYGPTMFESADYSAFLVMIAPYDEIIEPALQMKHNVQGMIDYLLVWTGLGMLGVVAVVFLLALAFSRSVTRPLHELLDKTLKLAAGDFDVKTRITSKDEFGELGRVFNSVGPLLKEHLAFTQSIMLAKEVQQSLLPHTPPEIPGLDIAGSSIYCDETGGDYYDYLCPTAGCNNRLSIIVGDVSGHGIQSALLMASARAFFRQRASKPGQPAGIVSDVNRQISEDVAETGQFMTAFYCAIDPEQGRIAWVRAGHDPGFVYDPEKDEFQELNGPGIALGLMSGYEFQGFEREIKPGQVLVVGTDGISEAHNADGGMFGKKRFQAVIRANAHRRAADIIRAMVAAVDDFRGNREQEDDVTLVVVKVTDQP